MKGFFSGVLITVPVTALILYLVMAGREETFTRMERNETTQQIQEELFDRDFQKAWEDLTAPAKRPSATTQFDQQFDASWSNSPSAKKEETEREKRLVELRARQSRFDSEFDRQFDRLQKDTADLRETLQEMGEGR